MRIRARRRAALRSLTQLPLRRGGAAAAAPHLRPPRYALCDRGGDGFSGEAIRTLLTEVENNRTNLLVILAGYEDKMLTNPDALVNSDPGLNRRFATRLHLPDYSPAELGRIVLKVIQYHSSATLVLVPP